MNKPRKMARKIDRLQSRLILWMYQEIMRRYKRWNSGDFFTYGEMMDQFCYQLSGHDHHGRPLSEIPIEERNDVFSPTRLTELLTRMVRRRLLIRRKAGCYILSSSMFKILSQSSRAGFPIDLSLVSSVLDNRYSM